MLQVLEIRPSIMWDKGKALEFLLESLGTVHYDKRTPSPYFSFSLMISCIHARVITIVFTPVFIRCCTCVSYRTTCPKEIA